MAIKNKVVVTILLFLFLLVFAEKVSAESISCPVIDSTCSEDRCSYSYSPDAICDCGPNEEGACISVGDFCRVPYAIKGSPTGTGEMLISCDSSPGCTCVSRPSGSLEPCNDTNDLCFGSPACCGGPSATCGNGICDASTDENSSNCPADCSAGSVAVSGVCGSATNATFPYEITEATKCSQGTPSQVTGGAPWYWTCYGSNGGSDAVCHTSFSILPAPPALTACVTNVCTGATYNGYYYYPAVDRMISSYCVAAYDDCTSPTYVFNDGSKYWWRQYGKDTVTCQNLQTPVPTCNGPMPDLKITASAYIPVTNPDGPQTLSAGEDYTVSWPAVADATSCTLDIFPAAASGGSQSFNTLNNLSTTHTLNCSGANGTGSDSVTVNIPPPMNSASAVCNSAGTLLTFNWSLPAPYTLAYLNLAEIETPWDCTSGSCNGSLPGGTKSLSITPNQGYNWWMHTQDAGPGSTGTNAWGPAIVGSITCPPAAPPAASADIKVNGSDGPVNLSYNGAADITWTSSNASSCTVTPPNWTGTSAGSGSHVLNLTSSVIYTLSCSPSGSNSTDTVLVSVPLPEKTLTVIKSGQGTVVSGPSGINCGTDCAEDYPSSTTVTLTETPASRRIFTGWSGVSCNGGNQRASTCTFTISSDLTVTANFAIDPNYKEF